MDADDDPGGNPRGLPEPEGRLEDARPRRRRPVPQRERLADRHQRDARPDQAHVRLARRQRRLRRPGPDPHPRDRLRPRARDPQFQAAGLLAGHRRVRGGEGRATRASTRSPTSRSRRTTSTTASTGSGTRRRPRRSTRRALASRGRAVTEEKKASTQASPRLYDLTTLQREVNNRFGLSARRTSQIAQALYERHKMITYPRTDSRALPEDYIPTCRQALLNLQRRPRGPREQGPGGAVARARTRGSSTTRRFPTTSPSSRRSRRQAPSRTWRRRSTT